MLCAEDICCRKEDPNLIDPILGVVERTLSDVDTHEPVPQRDYEKVIQCHEVIPQDQFRRFLRTGVPPAGTVLISWQLINQAELIPEDKLKVLERSFLVGDVVKRDARSAVSGTVIDATTRCTLALLDPPGYFRGLLDATSPAFISNGNSLEPFSSERLYDVPSLELKPTQEYREGDFILYDDWVGIIENFYDEVTLLLENGTVVVPENTDELESLTSGGERLDVGDIARTKKGNLRRGKWKYGAFNANVKPSGMAIEVRTVNVHVHWIARRLGGQQGSQSVRMPGAYPEPSAPPSELETDVLDSGNVKIYDKNLIPKDSSLPPPGTSSPYKSGTHPVAMHASDVQLYDRVRFRDLSGACVKYNGNMVLPGGRRQGVLTRIPRTETLGYDMNMFWILGTSTDVTVLWQDLTVTTHHSSELIPDPDVEDQDEVWPGEIVCSKHQIPEDEEFYEPERVGVVQSVNAMDRLTRVRWFSKASVKLSAKRDTFLPDAYTGDADGPEEEVSLYDIETSTALNRRRGDFVLVLPCHDADGSLSNPSSSDIDWFGEVVDLGLNGTVVVRLGAAHEVRDVQLPPERLILAYAPDVDGAWYENHPGDITDSEDEEMAYDEDEDVDSAVSDVVTSIWYEYEDGAVRQADEADEEGWSTADDDDDEGGLDLQMHDVKDSAIDTSETPPGAHKATREEVLAEPSFASTENQPSTNGDYHSESLNLTGRPNAPDSFQILDTAPPSDHHFVGEPVESSSMRMKRIQKEHKILRTSLPDGIYVRTWESRLDLLRVLIIGPNDTPYELAPFVIDFHLGGSFPQEPPNAFFHSWTDGNGPVNPNLYEDGKICLSLLGTWHADEKNESWNAARSTILQVLVSLMGLVLVKEPYYNEAGYEARAGTAESILPSVLYSERAYFRSRGFIAHALENKPKPFEDILDWLYGAGQEGSPGLLDRAVKLARGTLDRSKTTNEGERDGIRTISRGAAILLDRQLKRLERLKLSGCVEYLDNETAQPKEDGTRMLALMDES